MGLDSQKTGKRIARIGVYAFILGLIVSPLGVYRLLGESFIGGGQGGGTDTIGLGLFVGGLQLIVNGIGCVLIGTGIRLIRAESWRRVMMLLCAGVMFLGECVLLVWMGSKPRGLSVLDWCGIALPVMMFGVGVPMLLVWTAQSQCAGGK